MKQGPYKLQSMQWQRVAAYGKTSRGTDIHDIRSYDVRVEAKCFLKMHHMYSREAEFRDVFFEGVSGTTEQKAIIRAWPHSGIFYTRISSRCRNGTLL